MPTKIAIDDKIEILALFLPTLMQALASKTRDGVVDADDLNDLFALGIAAVLDNDDQLRTPQLQRLAAETATKRIRDHVKGLAMYRKELGRSLLSDILAAEQPAPDATLN